MFDLSKLFDQAIEMFKGGGLEGLAGSDLAGRLSELGIDSALLDGIQTDDIQALLNNAGIDISSLSDMQLNEIITSISENGGIENLDLSSFLDQSQN